MPRQRAAEFQVQALVAGIAREHRVGAGDHGGARGFVLYPVVVEHGALRQVHVGQHVAEVGVFAGAQVVFDDRRLGAAAQLHQVAGVDGEVAVVGGTYEHQVQRPVQARVLLQPQHHALPGQRRVEAREHLVLRRVAALHEVAGARIRIGQCLGQGLQPYRRRQRGEVGVQRVEAAVDEHHPRGRDAFEQRGIDHRHGCRYRGEAATLQRPQRGVLPGLAARQRQAVAQGRVQRLTAPAGVVPETRRQRVEQGSHQAAASGVTRSRIQA